ncbi:MAG: toxin TcdB middle/N-terminal domain-containing protein [Polyangiaceae bacterium]
MKRRARRLAALCAATLVTVVPAFAETSAPSEQVEAVDSSQLQSEQPVASQDDDSTAMSSAKDTASNGPAAPAKDATEAPKTPEVPAPETAALPTGGDKSGVTSKSISVPKGSGTIQGMEESFSAQLSTGIATFSVPFALPAARGGAQPSLGLSYSSSGGFGVAGAGWSVGVPYIARQTDRGVPGYSDQAGWHPNQDRFVFNGGQELVPICLVGAGGTCSGALQSEAMPLWASGWQYFRPRVEGSFLRFFWSPDHQTWRVQDKSGVTMELGVPLNDTSYTQALERDPDQATAIYRWHLVRQYDTYGDANPASGAPAPVNVVVYRYFQDGGMAYLSDIYDTPPKTNAATAALATYAHHTRLVYSARPDPTHSYRSGFRINQGLRLVRVDVASKDFSSGTAAARHQLRRYHLDYDPLSHISLLASVQVEGRCDALEGNAPAESNEALPDSTSCARLPAMRFDYSHVQPYNTSGGPGVADLNGYEGFDERLRTITSSPPHSVDEQLTDLFDINADSLPDVLVTAVGVYGTGHGVFFNGAAGAMDSFTGAQPMSVTGVLGAGASTITLKNLNVAALDLDGDGMSDLLHMPKVSTYSVYGPEKGTAGWTWKGRVVGTSDGLSPRIDLGKDSLDTQVMDVNFDGLVDVVVSSGTEMQTYFALGRYPGGDGRFGRATWTGATTAAQYTDPVRTCVPWSATPIRFSDSDIKTADMNGDGITDIVRVRKGDIRYWPGRGNGFWGTGRRDDCGAGTFGTNRHVTMTSSPQYTDIQGESLRLDDVNGDGLTDLVQVRFNGVDVWLNVDGSSWTPRHIIENTPPSPSYANRVRLVDINGSGTRDILWGDSGGYKYMDLAGGSRPSVLTRVENGLGKTTTLEYSTSAEEMLAAEQAGSPWSSKMPTSVHVVKRVVETDNLVVAGAGPAMYVTEYSYRDPVYEGRQREFRGFRSASAKRIGDANSPTDITESTFLLGECTDETPSNGVDECAISERWRDNPNEALKGLPVISEKRDEGGVYLSTEVTRYRLRRLYTGLDGREVRHAFSTGQDNYLYDVGAWAPASSTVTPTTVEVETTLGQPPDAALAKTTSVTLRSSTGRRQLKSDATVDEFGNRLTAVASGCIAGCTAADEVITTTTTPGRPTNDPTGWLWRTVSSKVVGNQYFNGDLQVTANTYDERGALTAVTKTLTGTLALDRFHATGASVAPTPVDASSDGTISVSNTYDDHGNLTREEAPDDRCRDVGYDDDYAQLPKTEMSFLGGCDSSNYFVTTASYDRGLAQVTHVFDIQGQPTAVAYDGFGRLTSITPPSPTIPAGSSPLPSVKIEYFLPTELGTPTAPTAYSIIHTQTHDGDALTDDEYLQSWSYVDGLGRTLVTLSEADTDANDAAAWIASGRVLYDAKGAVARKYLDHFVSVVPNAFPLAALPQEGSDPVPFGTQSYDAFGRNVLTTDLDGTVTLFTSYHALSSDMWDAADLEIGAATYGSYATETKDGHGRTVSTIERFKQSGAPKERETVTTYVPTGEPLTITRKLVGTSSQVTRWLRYDSLGRMVLNVEPNTSENFTTDHTALPSNLKAWHYVYNDNGELVGTSDARGCGVNFTYDNVGRLQSEDYSPCMTYHIGYSAPVLSTKINYEVYYQYDTAPTIIANNIPPGYFNETDETFLVGRLVAVMDMAAISVSKYDGRGRVIDSARRIAKPGIFQNSFANRYTTHWFQKSTAYDAADREISTTTGASISEVMAGGTASTIFTEYSRRGTVKRVDSSYGELVTSTTRSADGLMSQIVYGDIAHTTSDLGYDTRRRLVSATTERVAPGIWTSPPAGYTPTSTTLPSNQELLQKDEIDYDVVGNPTSIFDMRDGDEWPDEAKPVNRVFEYDDFYRLTRADYTYTGANTWKSPHDADNPGFPADPRRTKPMGQVSFTNRINWQTYAYDWLGNTSASDDDADGFYDRSLGTINNSSTKPYQLTTASNETTPGSPVAREGNLATAFDAAGNLTRLHVRRNGACLPSSWKCNHIFEYRYDEVGRLVYARRWDVTAANLGTPADPLPTTSQAGHVINTYDASDTRVIRQSYGPTHNTVYVFDTLELRMSDLVTSGSPPTSDYTLSKWTEVPYLIANGVRLARVNYAESSPEIGGNQAHVFLELSDHLGSNNIVIDHATSELVERGTYQPYGATESDYRPDRWESFREDYKFTGKEEDVTVGLHYFGKRFLSTHLNRWVSADPLTIHGLGADPNVYAYVSGRALQAVDPLGLEPLSKDAAPDPPAAGQSTPGRDAVQKVLEANGVVAADSAPAAIDCRAGCAGLDKLTSDFEEPLWTAPTQAQRDEASLKGLAKTGIDIARAGVTAGSVPFGPGAWYTASKLDAKLAELAPTRPAHPTLAADFERNAAGSG